MSQLTGAQLRQKYIEFFKQRGHIEIPPAPLVPENDPTTLFTSSGMQPLVPYLLGADHPSGNRLVDSQPSIRVQDIEEVGDNRHTTFFEMIGNWSLGDYFKKEQLAWFFEFLTTEVGLDPNKLYVSVFAGYPQANIPRDEESVEIWQTVFARVGIEAKAVELLTEKRGSELGMQGGRIFYYDAKKNWWARVMNPDEMPPGEPGGPDSEVFYEFTDIEHDPKFGQHCHPNCDCGRFMEIGNSVFMQYVKQSEGSFKPLPKMNVDFGGGLERILAVSHDSPDVFNTDLFQPIIQFLENTSNEKYDGENQTSMRVIADHMKAAVFLISQGLTPSNKQQGYVLRRLIRRATVKMQQLGIDPEKGSFVMHLTEIIVGIYKESYLKLDSNQVIKIWTEVGSEIHRFMVTLNKGLQRIKKQPLEKIDTSFAFDLFQTFGFPFELTQELVQQRGGHLNKTDFDHEFTKHQNLSRTASAGMFKGGLADHSETTTKYHTATHLLHAALRQVLGTHVRQKGSNITGERLRFDFSHPDKLTDRQMQAIEQLVNDTIEQDLPVSLASTTYDDAINQGALAFFGEKYPQQVKVYTIGDPAGEYFSKEICGGPHVDHTGHIGPIKIYKQESLGANTRRIYAKLA